VLLQSWSLLHLKFHCVLLLFVAGSGAAYVMVGAGSYGYLTSNTSITVINCMMADNTAAFGSKSDSVVIVCPSMFVCLFGFVRVCLRVCMSACMFAMQVGVHCL
jgi:hypothetical protein